MTYEPASQLLGYGTVVRIMYFRKTTKQLFLFYMYRYFVCMCMHHLHAVPVEARRKGQILWTWSYRWSWASLCMCWHRSSHPEEASLSSSRDCSLWTMLSEWRTLAELLPSVWGPGTTSSITKENKLAVWVGAGCLITAVPAFRRIWRSRSVWPTWNSVSN